MKKLHLPYQPTISGTVQLPGSKSISNRALLLAALARGTTVLTNLLDSDDTRHMRNALTAFNVAMEPQQQGLAVTGLNGLFQQPATNPAGTELSLNLGNAGTAMRPLTAILAASDVTVSLVGEERMYERPIGPLLTALRGLGAQIECLGEPGFPPLKIVGRQLTGGQIDIDGSASSQFISALLMLLPMLPNDSTVRLVGDVVSLPYIKLTVAMMKDFGAQVASPDARTFVVQGGTGYQSPGDYLVEGDASSASYFLAAAAIAGGSVDVIGVGAVSRQGDKRFAEVLASMGAKVDYQVDRIRVSKNKQLRGGRFDLNDIPDAAMTIATTAIFASGPTTIENVANWRLKETDRLAAMATELRKLGAQVDEQHDSIHIVPPAVPAHAEIATYNDHRMAMCFSLLQFAPAGITLLDPDCVNKTYPNYFRDLASLATN